MQCVLAVWIYIFFLNIVFEYWRFSSKPSIMVLFMLENWQGYGITMGFFNGIEVVLCYNQWWKYSIAEFDKNIINIIWEFENSNIYTYILLFFFTCKMIISLSIYQIILTIIYSINLLFYFSNYIKGHWVRLIVILWNISNFYNTWKIKKLCIKNTKNIY